MRTRFQAAPWSGRLKLISALSTMAVVVIEFFFYRGFPMAAGATDAASHVIALTLGAVFLGSLLFSVTGYAVEGNALHIERPFFSTRVSLAGLQRIWPDPDACRNSIRLFGNAGLFSFIGLYRNRKLGTYRLFATDFSQSVVLELPQRAVVITPATPDAFIAHMRRMFPGAGTGPPPHDI